MYIKNGDKTLDTKKIATGVAQVFWYMHVGGQSIQKNGIVVSFDTIKWWILRSSHTSCCIATFQITKHAAVYLVIWWMFSPCFGGVGGQVHFASRFRVNCPRPLRNSKAAHVWSHHHTRPQRWIKPLFYNRWCVLPLEGGICFAPLQLGFLFSNSPNKEEQREECRENAENACHSTYIRCPDVLQRLKDCNHRCCWQVSYNG